MAIQWDNKPKWLIDDRIYSLACADLPNEKKSAVLKSLTSNDVGLVKEMKLFAYVTSNSQVCFILVAK